MVSGKFSPFLYLIVFFFNAGLGSIETAWAAPFPLDFDSVSISPNLRLGKNFKTPPYYGLIRSQEQLKPLWNQLEDVRNETSLDWHPVPDPPKPDFSKFMLLWFADQGAKASFVELLSATHTKKEITCRIRVTHSDFGSRRLNLWLFPKIPGALHINEEHFYDQGP